MFHCQFGIFVTFPAIFLALSSVILATRGTFEGLLLRSRSRRYRVLSVTFLVFSSPLWQQYYLRPADGKAFPLPFREQYPFRSLVLALRIVHLPVSGHRFRHLRQRIASSTVTIYF